MKNFLVGKFYYVFLERVPEMFFSKGPANAFKSWLQEMAMIWTTH
jgi:hypothetical protein